MRNRIRSFGLGVCLTMVLSGPIVSEDRTTVPAAPNQTVTEAREYPPSGPRSDELETLLELRDAIGSSPLKGSSLYTDDSETFAQVLGEVMDSSASTLKEPAGHDAFEFDNQPEQIIRMLRSTSDELDRYAATFEQKNSYKLADRLRRLAKKNRLVARSLRLETTE